MATAQQNSPPQRNPLTESRHQREVFWQILVPIIAAGIVVVLIALLSAGLGMDDTRRWADISAIWLIAVWMAGALVWLLSLVVSIYVLQKVIRFLPSQSFRLQTILLALQRRLGNLGDRSVEPILKVNSFAASFKRCIGLPFAARRRRPGQ